MRWLDCCDQPGPLHADDCGIGVLSQMPQSCCCTLHGGDCCPTHRPA